ncbi:MAG: tol-pal system-associated acyl-CoA thioesterase [Kiloniellaceae bacterium]
MNTLSGHMEATAHVFSVRVYYEDTDAGGIVYYANYLKFAERARTEFLRLAGVDQSAMAARFGAGFAVRECSVDYRRPAYLDDLLQVRSRLTAMSGAALFAEQSIRRGDEELTRLSLRVVCLRRDGRPSRIPAPVRHALEPYVTSLEHA